mmetsp:Transcript_14324/g.34177  ORF Transcript_14324/g.34177 Transcript_14324/m.34177 type:complete len:98 (-) Transcript_14324:1884-2177(-)
MSNHTFITFVDDYTRWVTVFFLKGKMIEVCAQYGIMLEFSVPYEHQQNGVVERMGRTLCERAVAMLTHANLPSEFWPWAVQTAAYLRNLCPSSLAAV